MGLAVLFSRSLYGAEAVPVRVECHVAPGLPTFTVVGLPDAQVKESRERVRCAILSTGLPFPTGRLTVNLSPADLPKESARFDLPIALGLLLASGAVAYACDPGDSTVADAVAAGSMDVDAVCPDPATCVPSATHAVCADPTPADSACVANARADPGRCGLDGWILAGELSLTGDLLPVAAALTLALSVAREPDPRTFVVSADSASLAACVPGLRVRAAGHLRDVIAHVEGREALPVVLADTSLTSVSPSGLGLCLSDVQGQQVARRALELAAAGGHNLLYSGPPGTGKSMLAYRLTSILPPLTATQALEVAALAGLDAGVPGSGSGPDTRTVSISTQVPFRAPHHGASAAALVGGGARAVPGEVTRAHHGVLFLDELPEFDRRALESLREPLESGFITISRVQRSMRYPASLQLVAAMNPCPCGWRGHAVQACRCSSEQVQRYQGRLSGPLLDRMDICVELAAETSMQEAVGSGAEPAEASAVVRERVVRCRAVQMDRQGQINARLHGEALLRHGCLESQAQALLARAARRFGWSARTLHRVLRVARTAADLEGCGAIGPTHVAEAVQYRRSFWHRSRQ